VPHISLVFREMWGATVGRPFTTWRDTSRSAVESHISLGTPLPRTAKLTSRMTRFLPIILLSLLAVLPTHPQAKKRNQRENYVGDNACQSCHATQIDSFH
jgi:hypothetical protein